MIRSVERRGVVVAPLTVDAGDAVSDGVTYPGMALIGYFPEGKPGTGSGSPSPTSWAIWCCTGTVAPSTRP